MTAAGGEAGADVAPPDPEALAALHASVFTVPRPWSAAEFRALLASRGSFAVTRPAEPGLGGFALVRALAGEAELLTLAVAPDMRRQGIGRQLLEAALEGAAARGAWVMLLEVAADNAPAVALYEAAGFARVARRPRYYRDAFGDAVDALILSRALDPETT